LKILALPPATAGSLSIQPWRRHRPASSIECSRRRVGDAGDRCETRASHSEAATAPAQLIGRRPAVLRPLRSRARARGWPRSWCWT